MVTQVEFGLTTARDLCDVAFKMDYDTGAAKAWFDVAIQLSHLIKREPPPVNVGLLLRQARVYADCAAEKSPLGTSAREGYEGAAKRLRTVITATEMFAPKWSTRCEAVA